MGYDTCYTITITAATKKRRTEIAKQIFEHQWYPYSAPQLRDEFNDPVLEFQSRTWRRNELQDLGGKWYDENLKKHDKVRGIQLNQGERIDLLGVGDDETEDIYRIIATPDMVVRQKAIITVTAERRLKKGEKCEDCDDYGCDECEDRSYTYKFPQIKFGSLNSDPNI